MKCQENSYLLRHNLLETCIYLNFYCYFYIFTLQIVLTETIYELFARNKGGILLSLIIDQGEHFFRII